MSMYLLPKRSNFSGSKMEHIALAKGPVFDGNYVPYFYSSGKFLAYVIPGNTGFKATSGQGYASYDFTSDLTGKGSFPAVQTVEDIIQKAVAAAKNEIVQLENMINALRDQMENMKFDRIEVEQKARVDANDEIAQLKATTCALRDELDKMKIEHEHDVQKHNKESHDETKHLTNMIAALRDQLEEKHG